MAVALAVVVASAAEAVAVVKSQNNHRQSRVGNHFSENVCMLKKGVVLSFPRIIPHNNTRLENTLVYWGYMGMMQKKMETIIVSFHERGRSHTR